MKIKLFILSLAFFLINYAYAQKVCPQVRSGFIHGFKFIFFKSYSLDNKLSELGYKNTDAPSYYYRYFEKDEVLDRFLINEYRIRLLKGDTNYKTDTYLAIAKTTEYNYILLENYNYPIELYVFDKNYEYLKTLKNDVALNEFRNQIRNCKFIYNKYENFNELMDYLDYIDGYIEENSALVDSLFLFAHSNEYKSFERIINANPGLINSISPNGGNLFHATSDKNIVKLLVKKGLVYEKDYYYRYPYYFFRTKKDIMFAKKNKIPPIQFSRDAFNNTPLFYCKNPTELKLFTEEQVAINKFNEKGKYAYHYANTTDLFKLYLENGLDINYKPLDLENTKDISEPRYHFSLKEVLVKSNKAEWIDFYLSNDKNIDSSEKIRLQLISDSLKIVEKYKKIIENCDTQKLDILKIFKVEIPIEFLEDAIKNHNICIFRYLKNMGYNFYTENNQTLMDKAIYYNNVDLINLLKQQKLFVSIDQVFDNAVKDGSQLSTENFIKILNGAKRYKRKIELDKALKNNKSDIFYLIYDYCDYDAKIDALDYAMKSNLLEKVKFIISKTPDIEVNPYYAIAFQNMELLEILESNGYKPDKKALENAVTYTPLPIVKHIIEKGNFRNDTAVLSEMLKIASESNNPLVIDFLLTLGSKVDSSIVERLILSGKPLLLEKYLNLFKYDIGEVSNRQLLIFKELYLNQYTDMIDYLCNKGYSLKFVDEEQNNMLHYAAEMRDTSLISYLISLGINVNTKNSNGQTPLDNALKAENAEIICFLIKHKADIKMCYSTKWKDTILLLIAETDEIEIAKYLIENGAKLDVFNDEYETPFDIALESEKEKMAEFFLQYTH